ncbi:hypothetical protein, partial [Paraburkholderia aspalathi]|uniref:hypothetical protein n=1 Tax=Paraburkholderia aspalathi TaxID=1324617 RepID=UPI001BA8E495
RTDRHVARLSCPARMHRDVPHLPTKRVTSYLWVNLSSAIKAAMRFLLRFHVEFSGLLAAPFRSGLQASPP